ncbi:MAG: hypothetical protein JW749_03215 [Sedimentisphaerales bacterium]|nr:hypothetical protein [Sedimentisphaerales bacterium]
MATQYSADICRRLQVKFKGLGLYRPMRVSRYEAGTELTYSVTGIEKRDSSQVRLLVERFVGGGFAGQVYRVKILDIQNQASSAAGLEPGGIYAMKILVPPSNFSRFFRNFLYAVGFQGPFQLQVNPAAARAGAIWQKFIRRAAQIRFGDQNAVVDIHATFIDEKIGSCGELSEWVEGRTWRLEVDDRMDVLKLWRRGRTLDETRLGSPEYRAKKRFMADFVKLLHNVGAYEFARQYEWSTCKSQPNVLKRWETGDEPTKGLTAVDFRPGLVLLPFLPMSPGDFKLIAKGICRGSLVQFDRGDVSKLEKFVRVNKEHFADMQPMLDELKADEQAYRNSVPDITQNDIRLLYDRRLWSTILDSAVTGWKVRNLVDDGPEKKLRAGKLRTILFLMLGLIPFLGKFIRRLWARADWRRHYAGLLSSWDYFKRALTGKIIEKTIDWYRSGRLSDLQTMRIAWQPWWFFLHLPFLLLVLPGLHRFVTDSAFRKEKLIFLFVRPFRLYFHAHLREQWLREMVAEGQKKHMLTNEDADVILSQVNEPYIQKYLVSLVVHLMTLPVTQIVSVSLAFIYVLMHPEMPRVEVWTVAAGIVALFQVIPISPGSFCRGIYVLYLVIRERNFKDYNIAVFLGFFKYIGYLAFPIQMTYRYPILARFMAAHWATEIVHIVPVFGERGALLEHWVFGLFYNWPLTIRRRMRRRAEIRETIAPRYWHAGICIVLAVFVFYLTGFIHLNEFMQMEGPGYIKGLVAMTLLLCGVVITIGCGGAKLVKRIITSAVSGVLIGMLSISMEAIINYPGKVTVLRLLSLLMVCSRYAFIFALVCTIGAVITELILPDPDLKGRLYFVGD